MSDRLTEVSRYFIPPDLKQAKRRGKEEVQVLQFEAIPEDMREIGRGKHYLIKTYGCQMNVHDSETIAGILQSMGYSPTDREEDADVILLNTCAIRENAEDKVFGELGRLKPLKVETPRTDSGRVRMHVPGRGGDPPHFATASVRGFDFRNPQHPQASLFAQRGAVQQGNGGGGLVQGGGHCGKSPESPAGRPEGVGQHHVRVRQVLHLLHRPLHPRERSGAAVRRMCWRKSASWPGRVIGK